MKQKKKIIVWQFNFNLKVKNRFIIEVKFNQDPKKYIYNNDFQLS